MFSYPFDESLKFFLVYLLKFVTLKCRQGAVNIENMDGGGRRVSCGNQKKVKQDFFWILVFFDKVFFQSPFTTACPNFPFCNHKPFGFPQGFQFSTPKPWFPIADDVFKPWSKSFKPFDPFKSWFRQ